MSNDSAVWPRRGFLKACASAGIGVAGSYLLQDVVAQEGKTMNGSARTGTGYVFEDTYMNFEHEDSHPESPERLAAIKRIMDQSGLIARVTKLTPRSDPMPYVRKIHTDRHVAAISSLPVIGKTAELAVGGALAGIAAVSDGKVRNAFCALRPPGHHARNTCQEEGFCYYNNIAIATRFAQETAECKKILIVDWDFHHGNGTEEAFYEDPTVLFFSTHNWHAYPGTGDPSRKGKGAGYGFNINVHLPCGATDADIISAFQTKLLPKAIEYKPDFVLISAGFDSRRDDTLGCFAVTDAGFVNLTQIAMDIAHTFAQDRLVSLLEGGYNTDGLSHAVRAHVKTLLEYQPKRI
jgi:acetoin utilization deacetylase AcuC-like enzyme